MKYFLYTVLGVFCCYGFVSFMKSFEKKEKKDEYTEIAHHQKIVDKDDISNFQQQVNDYYSGKKESSPSANVDAKKGAFYVD